MADTNSPRKRREPRAWIYENGEKRPLVVEPHNRMSEGAKWLEKHYPLFEIVDMRAVLK